MLSQNSIRIQRKLFKIFINKGVSFHKTFLAIKHLKKVLKMSNINVVDTNVKKSLKKPLNEILILLLMKRVKIFLCNNIKLNYLNSLWSFNKTYLTEAFKTNTHFYSISKKKFWNKKRITFMALNPPPKYFSWYNLVIHLKKSKC